ncbi:MAG: hypothetical protein QHH80_13935, partial [Anaerolineae bacterium]|nr:hypothetical protein [Anaerolineae bacterium]
MSQPPAVPLLPEPRVWHRHPIVLIRTVFLPFGGVLTLLAAWAVDGTTNGAWVRGVLLAGSVVLVWRAIAAITLPSPGPQTPASQRQGVLQRVTGAVRWLMAIVAIALAAG